MVHLFAHVPFSQSIYAPLHLFAIYSPMIHIFGLFIRPCICSPLLAVRRRPRCWRAGPGLRPADPPGREGFIYSVHLFAIYSPMVHSFDPFVRPSSPLGVDPVQGAQAQGVDPRTRQVHLLVHGPFIRSIYSLLHVCAILSPMVHLFGLLIRLSTYPPLLSAGRRPRPGRAGQGRRPTQPPGREGSIYSPMVHFIRPSIDSPFIRPWSIYSVY